MIARRRYMEGEVDHRAYYGQFVTEAVKNLVLRQIGRDLLLASKKQAFNDIRISCWDAIVPSLSRATYDQLKQAGDWLSPNTGVCILKEAARQIVESRALEAR